MKNKVVKILIFALVSIMLFGTVTANAFNSYDTYTYSIDGEPLKSPAAYVPNDIFDSAKMNIDKFVDSTNNNSIKELGMATDIVTDSKSNVYIADPKNNRIVILNKYYSTIKILTSYEYNGKVYTFDNPQGVFVNDENDQRILYVCDTNHKDIVVFNIDEGYECQRIIEKPDSTLVGAANYIPIAIAVDLYGRLFVVSSQTTDGVIVMSPDGDFNGFIGAQKVTGSLIEAIWRRFQSREQREMQSANVSIPYNNITVDKYGFVYVTNNGLDESQQLKAIKSKNADYSPVKKLNSAGVEIMKRNGFFDPGGEVAVSTFGTNAVGVSSIVDIAIGEHESWSIIDEKRSRVFTYDKNGNLLFAFGDKGDQLGNASDMDAITYHNVDGVNYLLALDGSGGSSRLTVYAPTDYCNTIMSALNSENHNEYAKSIEYWEAVLMKNNNFDLAYIGIGKALYNQGKYDEAMEMLANAYETTQYSKAFAEIRKNIIGNWLLVFVIVIVALCVGMIKFLGWAKKKNKATSLKVGKKTYVEELVYLFHLQFHPFDGFYDLKHEKRGSVRAGLTIMGLTILAFFYQSIGRGYVFNPRETYSTIIVQILSIGVPVLLWCVGNWCLTTLFEGEGSFKDIFVATTYSLAPLPLFVIVSTILTNVLTASEGSIVSLLVTLGYIWVGFLLFFGMLVTHDYSLGKSVLIAICTIVAMVVIMFVAILFSSLVIKMITFIVSIITEIANRA